MGVTEKPWLRGEEGKPVPFFNQDVWCPKCQQETRHKLATAGYESPSPYFGGHFFVPPIIQCEKCGIRHT
jgi:C4-type Zn-finger protein